MNEEGEKVVRLSAEEQASFVRAVAIFVREQVDRAVEERMKEFRFVGAYDEHTKYFAGNFAVRNGSCWYCRAAETRHVPGESADWVLIAKRGSDGRDSNRVPTRSASRIG
jgi:hypothetical protein